MGRPRRSTAKPKSYREEGVENAGNNGKDEDVVVQEVSYSDDDDLDADGLISEPESESEKEEEEAIEEEEVVVEVKKPSKKKSTVKGTKNSTKAAKTSKGSAPSNGGDSSRKEITQTRHITNVKDKLFRLFGDNKAKLIELLELKREWEDAIFDFPQDYLQEYQPAITLKDIPSIQTTKISKTDFVDRLNLTRDINFQYNDNPRSVFSAGEIKPNGRAHILNTGGVITDIAWLRQDSNDNNKQYVAIAVSDITNDAAAPELAIRGGHSFTSGILIYELDTQTSVLTLYKSFVHEWGNAWDLQWKKHDGLGVLSAVFNDGKLRLLKLDTDNIGAFLEITKPSFEYSLPDTLITTYDWNNDKIICGTDKGEIAEFVLLDEIPSFVYPLHTGYIFSTRVALSKYDETLVYTACSDGLSSLFSTKDIVTTKIYTPKSRTITKNVAYSPQLYSFIQLEGHYMTKLEPSRALFVMTPLVKHEGSTESIATSNLHPMLLSGGADGKIKITNIARRLLNGQKQALQSHKILSLWELQYSEKEGGYRLTDNLQPETIGANETSMTNIYPSGISFNSIKWNENLKAGKWYAAGSTSGLVIIEHLGN